MKESVLNLKEKQYWFSYFQVGLKF